MQENTLKKRDIEELEKLVQIAKEQGNTINLNIVYMTIDSEKIDFAEVMKYFEDRGITMIEGDVEPDITASWSVRRQPCALQDPQSDLPAPPDGTATLL